MNQQNWALMQRDLSLKRIIAQTKLYAVDDALLDLRLKPRFSVKPEHDRLYEYAISAGLAGWLTITIGKHQRPPQALLSLAESRIRRARWWPANSGQRPPPDVLLIRTESFDNRWANIRAIAEADPRGAAIWHDDPALFTRLPSGELVCRTACVGHEGMMRYLAYDHEDDWTGMLEQCGLELCAQGEDTYITIIRKPGLFAEGQADNE
jgi:hypothetical protein